MMDTFFEEVVNKIIIKFLCKLVTSNKIPGSLDPDYVSMSYMFLF